MWLLFTIIVGVMIYFFVQSEKMKGPMPPRPESPRDILKRRYAQGEITREEFEKMKTDIKK